MKFTLSEAYKKSRDNEHLRSRLLAELQIQDHLSSFMLVFSVFQGHFEKNIVSLGTGMRK